MQTRLAIDETTGSTNSLRIVFLNSTGANRFKYVFDGESRNLLLHCIEGVRAEQDIICVNELTDVRQARFLTPWIWRLDWNSEERHLSRPT